MADPQQFPTYSPPFILKKGRVEINKLEIDTTGNAHTIRILPDMDGMGDIPTYLPRFGPFFFENPRSYDAGEIVWVLCSPDFQVGYTLGVADAVGGNEIKSILDRINPIEWKFGLPESDCRSADITFVTDQAIDFVNKKYGHAGRIMNSGAISLFTGDGSIYLSSKGADLKIMSNGTMQQNAQIIEQNVQTIKETSASHLISTQGYIEEIAGSKKENIGVSLSRSIGGDSATTTAGDENNVTFKKKSETAGMGYTIQVILPLGSIDLNALLGAINFNSIFLNAPLGFANPMAGPGPFCTIPFCLLTGIPHTGRKFVGVPLP